MYFLNHNKHLFHTKLLTSLLTPPERVVPVLEALPGWAGQAGPQAEGGSVLDALGVDADTPDPQQDAPPQSDNALQRVAATAGCIAYCGHGAGDRHLTALADTACAAAVLLMGCSSGRLAAAGEFDPRGPALRYLFAGSPGRRWWCALTVQWWWPTCGT